MMITAKKKKSRRSPVKCLKKAASCDAEWVYLVSMSCNLVCYLTYQSQIGREIGFNIFIPMIAFVVVRFLWVLPILSLYTA
jgi:hypothetical protein